MSEQHWSDIDAEYCFAEGGGITRLRGTALYATVQVAEKHARTMELVAHGVSGHASVPLESNPIVHLGAALQKIGAWVPPIVLTDTVRAYFTRLADVSPAIVAQRYRDVLDPRRVTAVEQFFRAREPRHAALLHATLSPTILAGGQGFNVIPSEAKATLDVRMLPEEDPATILRLVRQVVGDPAVTVDWAPRTVRPTGTSSIETEAFKSIEQTVKKHYGVPTLPTLGTGATDMSFLRAKGVQCYGIGPAVDDEDGPRGYGAHGDQERILESELERFVRFQYDLVVALASSVQ